MNFRSFYLKYEKEKYTIVKGGYAFQKCEKSMKKEGKFKNLKEKTKNVFSKVKEKVIAG